MSPDPYSGSYDVNNPQSMNRYTYVMNNPLAYVDPDGLKLIQVGQCVYDQYYDEEIESPDYHGDYFLVGCYDNEGNFYGYTVDNGGPSIKQPAPRFDKTITQQCLSQYNNSTAGKIVQLFSLYHLATNFKHVWAEWTVLPVLKIYSLKGLDKAIQSVGNAQFLSVTGGSSTVIQAPTSAFIQKGEKIAGDLAMPALISATAVDIVANAGCGIIGRQAAGQMTPLPPGVEVSF